MDLLTLTKPTTHLSRLTTRQSAETALADAQGRLSRLIEARDAAAEACIDAAASGDAARRAEARGAYDAAVDAVTDAEREVSELQAHVKALRTDERKATSPNESELERMQWTLRGHFSLPVLSAELIERHTRRLAEMIGIAEWQSMIERGIAAGRC